MSSHLNPASALSDHRESTAWLISNGRHSAAYCYKLGPKLGQGRMLMSPKGCHHLPTHSCHNRLCLATATNHQGYEDPAEMQGGFIPSSLARFHSVGIARSAHAVHQHPPCHMRQPCDILKATHGNQYHRYVGASNLCTNKGHMLSISVSPLCHKLGKDMCHHLPHHLRGFVLSPNGVCNVLPWAVRLILSMSILFLHGCAAPPGARARAHRPHPAPHCLRGALHARVPHMTRGAAMANTPGYYCTHNTLRVLIPLPKPSSTWEIGNLDPCQEPSATMGGA